MSHEKLVEAYIGALQNAAVSVVASPNGKRSKIETGTPAAGHAAIRLRGRKWVFMVFAGLNSRNGRKKISYWCAGDVYESLHTGSPQPKQKAAIADYHSLNQATRTRRCRNKASPLAKADAMGSRSLVCVQASIVAIRHRAKGIRLFPTNAQAAR